MPFLFSAWPKGDIVRSNPEILAKARPVSKSTYEYYYAIRDHLGSTRVLFKMVSGTATIIQENHFYPFGMEMDGAFAAGSNKYRFNGKELNDDFGLGWYDYGWRMFDPAIGRWNSIDNLAEKFYPHSPYHYAGNNPI